MSPQLRRFHLDQTYLLITRHCNIACDHCIRSSSPYEGEYMCTNLAKKIIDSVSEINKKSAIIISGGEPTLHKDFSEIVRYTASKARRIIINSNGLRLKQLLDISDIPSIMIQISLDGDQIVHDMVRGEGTFKKALRSVFELGKQGVKTVISTTVSNKNISSLMSLDKQIRKYDFYNWNIKRIVGAGRADDKDDISTEKWNFFSSEEILRFYNLKRISISNMFKDDAFSREYEKKYFDYSSLNCGTGRSKLYINPNGTVYPCACMESIIVGDLNKLPLTKIIKNLAGYSFEPDAGSICHHCPAWIACNGGCPGIGLRIDEKNLGDPRCPIVKLSRKKEV